MSEELSRGSWNKWRGPARGEETVYAAKALLQTLATHMPCGKGWGMDIRLMQDWLGHLDIRHTAWYSRTSAKRFDGVRK